MSFDIDRQTLDELNLPGKFRHGSVHSLFSQVKTRGGEQLLEAMFRQPLEEPAVINRRSDIFRSFGEAAVDFPFGPEETEMVREYLDAGSAGSRWATYTDVAIKQLLSRLTRDERYIKMVRGLQATIMLLQQCHTFIQTAGLLQYGPYASELKEMERLLSLPALDRLRRTDVYRRLSVDVLAFYDDLLKRRLSREMESILRFIYEIDVYIAVSGVARAKGFGYARALPTAAHLLCASALRHPCMDEAVGNDLSLDADCNVLFLTGANMAGKSTLMKSVSIALYLAHIGFPVAATEMRFSIREGLYTSINTADDISQGYSHFYAEVVRVKQAADAVASGKRVLLVFDELFKGTNVKDAYDGTLAVTEAFSEFRECLFIISTHIIEVGEALRGRNNIQFMFMPTVMDGVHPRYTYQLREGITEDRQGMMIIRNEGILELLRNDVRFNA